MQKMDFDKTLLRFHKEEMAIGQRMRNLGWTELIPPIQQGFIRSFTLRADVKRTKQAPFFEAILAKINTTQWSCRKDFKKKRKRFGKKVYVVREQQLLDVDEREFCGHKFKDTERAYFYEVLTHVQTKKPIKVYRFAEPWRFVLRVQPNMITKVRVMNLDLEKRSADIGRYFSIARRTRLLKLLHGYNVWKQDDFPNPKYRDPMRNRSFADLLQEYHPEPPSKNFTHQPSENPGVLFYKGLCGCAIHLGARCLKMSFALSCSIGILHCHGKK